LLRGLCPLSIALLAACGDDPPGGNGRPDVGPPDTGIGRPDTGQPRPDTGIDTDGGVGADTGAGDATQDGGGSDGGDGDGGDDGGAAGDGGNTGGDGGDDGGNAGGDGGDDGGNAGGDGGDDGGNAGDGGGDGGNAGGDAGDGGNAGGDAGDGGNAGADAGNAGDGGNAGGDGGGDGGAGDGGNDGGLGGSLSDFCMGTGAVVDVGGGVCSGNVAQNTFRFGVCTCMDLQAQSNLLIDAFDSSLGGYGAPLPGGGANVHSDGHVGVNGELMLAGRLTCMGSTFVSGGGFSVGNQSYVDVNVYAAGDATQINSASTIQRNAFIDGNVIGRYDIGNDLYVPVGASVDPQTNVTGNTIYGALQPVTPCPCDPADILDIQTIIDFGQTYNDNATLGVVTSTTWATGTGPSQLDLPCGRYYLTNILHTTSLTIRALGRVVLYIDGDLNVSGALRLEVDPGAEIDVFVGGSLIPGASLRFGETDRPSSVRTYVAGGGIVNMGANSTFGGNLYAPFATVVFGASTDIYGSLFCAEAEFGGNAAIHFDTDIRSAGDDCDAGTGGDGGTDGGVADGGAGADAGTGDAGATPCTQCFECMQQACLIPPGGSMGVCGPCLTDLDCCPTDICVNGSCVPTF
jgi:hypothetical protein